MFFQVYGETSLWQLFGWLCVFVGLILLNEVERRTKIGGIFCFVVVPIVIGIYCIAVTVAAGQGAEWALNNQTYLYQNGWFHYAKLYAADIGCVGFMMIKYKWWIGKEEWFRAWPFLIVAINILIAVVSDFESAFKGMTYGQNGWWFSSEGVWLYGGWWNILNALAGIINIFCMTGWWRVYSSKDKNRQDMIWPDMTWQFILAYDVWNFTYTYLNLPTHSWYCGVALLLAPTFAAAFWNKGGWIQNRANTLATWCMFAQLLPLFQIKWKTAVLPSLYNLSGVTDAGILSNPAFALTQITDYAEFEATGIVANPIAQGIFAIAAIVINVVVLTDIIRRSKKLGVNPYKGEVFTDVRDSIEAYERADAADVAAAKAASK